MYSDCSGKMNVRVENRVGLCNNRGRETERERERERGGERERERERETPQGKTHSSS